MRSIDGGGLRGGERTGTDEGRLGLRRDAAVARHASVRERPTRRTPRHIPLTRHDLGAWNQRDRALLTRIARAQALRDRRSVCLVAGELLRPYLPGVQALVARRTAWLGLQPGDREEIVSTAIERLLSDLSRDPYLKGVPFGAVAATKVADAIVDFLRARRRRVHEKLTAPHELPEVSSEDAPTLVEQVAAADAILGPLRQREREIVYERYVLGHKAGEVARRRDISTAAVKMTCSRSLRKIRDAAERGDVTFPGLPSVSRGERPSGEDTRTGKSSGGTSGQGKPLPHDCTVHEEKSEV